MFSPPWLAHREAGSLQEASHGVQLQLRVAALSSYLLQGAGICLQRVQSANGVLRWKKNVWGWNHNNLQERVSEWKDEDQSGLKSDRCFVSSAHVRRLVWHFHTSRAKKSFMPRWSVRVRGINTCPTTPVRQTGWDQPTTDEQHNSSSSVTL